MDLLSGRAGIVSEKELRSGLALRCTRCSTWLRVEFAFCINCGLKSNSKLSLSVSEEKRKNPPTERTNLTGSRRGKKESLNAKKYASSTTLNLPRNVLSALDSILAKPAVDDQVLTKRLVQQFQTQVLEMRNAEGVEMATLNKHVSSLALEAPSMMGTSKYEVVQPPSHYYSSADHSGLVATTSSSTTHRKVIPAVKPRTQYLDNVASISTHYRRYLARLKQLEGLRAAMMEPPPLPSELQRESATASRNGTRSIADRPESTTSDHDPGVALALYPAPTIPTTGLAVETEEEPVSAREETTTSSGGGAFMWGPIFNPGGSVADGSLPSTASQRQGVVLLNAEEALRASPGPSNNVERIHADNSATSMPVAMFWGNMMQNQEEEEPDGLTSPAGSSKYPSRMGSFLSASSQRSLLSSEMIASEEAELPVWIEALAAETAEFRDEFHEEDVAIMQQVGDRLSQLDTESILLQSQRALLVQYSMDAVVQQYWDRIEQLKTGMGLTSTPYKLLAYGPNENEWSGEENEKIPDGAHEELRAAPEDEEQVRAEITQGFELEMTEDRIESTSVASVASNSTSFYPSKTDRGTVLHQWEKQDFREAVTREKLHTEDELMMQNLILDLVKAHRRQQATEVVPEPNGNTAATSLEPKVSLTFETVARPQTATEHRIAGLLQSWEEQEESERRLREGLEDTDDLALKHWLVAVSAVDSERATKQILRTLQLEDLEDNEGDSEDEDSVSSATKRANAEKESATLVVPENSSLSVIKTLYRQSCSKMLAFLSELNVDFTVDQTDNPDFRSEARTKLQFARRILKTSSNVDHKVAVEYRNFLDHCSLRRTAIAMQLSEAMLHASQLDQSYRERYAEATREFKAHNDAQQIPGSEATRHITSSKHMQAIKLSAELDMRAQGEVVKNLQADEAKLLLDIRQEQFVLSEVLGLWQTRHSRTLHSYSLAFKRLSVLVDSTKIS